MPNAVDARDFFISFNSADLAYAEAINAALRAAGFTTFYHPRDLPPGGNIPMWMDDALMNSAQTLALYSPAYTSEKAIYSKPNDTRAGLTTPRARSASSFRLFSTRQR